MERVQRAATENVIHCCRVQAMQRNMDILKHTVEELRKEKYPSTNTERLSDTSP